MLEKKKEEKEKLYTDEFFGGPAYVLCFQMKLRFTWGHNPP